MKGKILLVPHGGLANRMNALLSVVNFCDQYEYDLEIVWFRNKWLNARFEELFQMAETPLKIRNNTFKDLFLLDHGRRGNFHFPLLWQKWQYDKVLHWQESLSMMKGGMEPLLEYVGTSSKIYINSCYALCPKAPVNKTIRLAEALQERVDRVVRDSFSERMVGVHIRRTDLALAIQESPIEAFIQRMRVELAENPQTRFYLASDDNDVKRTLRAEFDLNQLVILDHSADRNSSEGIKNGLVDMYLLSSTQLILGSYGSVFSLMAAEIGGVSHEVVRK